MIRRGVGNILGKSKQNQEKEQSSTKGNKVNKIKGELIDGFFLQEAKNIMQHLVFTNINQYNLCLQKVSD